MAPLINANPVVHERTERTSKREDNYDDSIPDIIDQLEVFDHVRDITDPEHPYSLEQLNVVTEDSIFVDDSKSYVKITFTPTVQHCSMATIIGLSLRLKLLRSLPPRFKVDIVLAPGSHSTEAAINKQLNDKERVAAAFENPNLVDLVEKCLVSSEE
jgi:metal-sulfur cluster biosynthetic enzyme